ncbi:MAG: hypothetical protein PHU51_05265 [Candidatus Nanoarchaeia archaeon]|nr:hypothetical protein [Candidatus Nanoarchaeia archaeon]
MNRIYYLLSKLRIHKKVVTKYINIRIKRQDQLFNSFDPSPFIEKDLDNDAIEYLVSYFEEYGLNEKIEILIHLPKSQKRRTSEKIIKKGIHNYFEYKKDIESHKIKKKLESSRVSFIIGLMILISCMGLKYALVARLMNYSWASAILSEGLTIGGWVAMWKPMGEILYEWLPLKRDRDIYNKISEAQIEFIYE